MSTIFSDTKPIFTLLNGVMMEEGSMGYVIGIDGGGTKTEIVLADLKGSVFAKSLGGPTNPNLIDAVRLEQNFRKLFQQIQLKAPQEYQQVTSVFAGISGAGTEEAQEKIRCILSRIISEDVHIQVQPDSINALYSGTFGAPGIVQIAGTGSITYGINERNEHCRIGGWGYLFGDEGSGFDFGKQAVIAVLAELDGIGPKTKLTERLLNHFNVPNGRMLISKIYHSAVPKDELSPLSKVVFQVYKENDTVAIEIIKSAAKRLVDSILSLYDQHYKSNINVKVVLCGGVFKEKMILPRLIEQELLNYKYLQVVQPKMQPAGGSLIGAYLIENQIPTDEMINNMINTLKGEDEK